MFMVVSPCVAWFEKSTPAHSWKILSLSWKDLVNTYFSEEILPFPPNYIS